MLTCPSDSVLVEAEKGLADKLKPASKLLMNAAPSLQALKQWSVRSAAYGVAHKVHHPNSTKAKISRTDVPNPQATKKRVPR